MEINKEFYSKSVNVIISYNLLIEIQYSAIRRRSQTNSGLSNLIFFLAVINLDCARYDLSICFTSWPISVIQRDMHLQSLLA